MKKTYAKTVKRVFSAFLAVSLLTSNVNLGGLFKNMSVTAFAEESKVLYHWDFTSATSAEGWEVHPQNNGPSIKTAEGYVWFPYTKNSTYWIVSPEIDTKNEAAILSFKHKGDANDAGSEIEVDYSATDNNNTSFTRLASESIIGSEWQVYNVELPKETKYFSIEHKNGSAMYVTDVIVYAPHTPYKVEITGGTNATPSGSLTQENVDLLIERVTYTANEGYYFDKKLFPKTVNGITAEYKDEKTIVVSGLPTAETSFIVPDATAYPVYDVTITGGENAAPSGGETTQSRYNAIETVTYTAKDGYMFERFASKTDSGITVTWKSESSVEVSGTPTANVTIAVPDAVINKYYTVYDKTDVSELIPLYGEQMDKITKGQFVIPSSALNAEQNKGKYITLLRFYSDDTSSVNWDNVPVNVYLDEVDFTKFYVLRELQSAENLIKVYSGTVSVSNGVMDITLDMPYEYKGGNLLIGMENTEGKTAKRVGFYGEIQSGGINAEYASACSGVASDGNNLSIMRPNFIPKTSFVFENRTPTMYTVTLPEHMELCTGYTLSDGKAKAGERIKVKVSDGYTIKDVKVNNTAIEADSDGYYTFVVYGNTTVTADIQKIVEKISKVTINDGKIPNNVPLNFEYINNKRVGQFVVPEDDLKDYTGKQITTLKFYCNHGPVSFAGLKVDVYLKGVDSATLDKLVSKEDCTTVYSGGISISDMIWDPISYPMEIKFNKPYLYNGGNLLIGMENTETIVPVEGISFLGTNKETVGVSISGDLAYPELAGRRNFVPRTTITFEVPEDKTSAETIEKLTDEYSYTYGMVESGDKADKDKVYIIYSVDKAAIEGKDHIAVMHKEGDAYKEIKSISNGVIDTVYEKIKFPDGSTIEAGTDKYIVAVKLNNTEKIKPSADVFKFEPVSSTEE